MKVEAHHMSFPVRDIERSKQFYGDILGLTEIPRPESFTFPGAWFQAGPGQVHLIQVDEGADVGAPPSVLNPLGLHSAFAVESYGETVAHMKKAGLEILETNEEMGQLWVKDPDGHIIELIAVSGG